MYDVRELKENHPEFALLLETSGDESVQFSNLNYTKVPVHDLEVDSYILVRAGEVCCFSLYKNLLHVFPNFVSFLSLFTVITFSLSCFRLNSLNITNSAQCYVLSSPVPFSCRCFFSSLDRSELYLIVAQFLYSLGCAC